MEYIKPRFYKLVLVCTHVHTHNTQCIHKGAVLYLFAGFLYRKMSNPPPISDEEDIDVKEERRRVMADENTEDDVLVLKDLTKIFHSNEAGLSNCSYSVSWLHTVVQYDIVYFYDLCYC